MSHSNIPPLSLPCIIPICHSEPYWEVDLGAVYEVQRVIIYNRNNNEFWTGWDRLSDSVVSLIKDDVIKAVYEIVDASNLASADIAASDFVSVSSTLLCCCSSILLLPITYIFSHYSHNSYISYSMFCVLCLFHIGQSCCRRAHNLLSTCCGWFHTLLHWWM